jgi:hypothetical protein
MKPKIQPYLHLVKPFQVGIEELFHEGIIVAASGKETKEEEDLTV